MIGSDRDPLVDRKAYSNGAPRMGGPLAALGVVLAIWVTGRAILWESPFAPPGLIEEVEGFERGRYGGAVGWVDASGDGTWAVTIRCAEFTADRTSARLVAGGGIVAESEPLAELAETQAKFQAMLGAIVRG